jgi:DNA polymerase-1
LKGKLKERVEEFAEQARLSRRLAVIDINAPVQFSADAFAIEEFDRPLLEDVFKELEFRTLAQAILGDDKDDDKPKDLFGKTIPEKSTTSRRPQANYSLAEKNIDNLEHHYEIINTLENRQRLISDLEKQSTFCFDTETTNIDPNAAELVGMSFSFEKGKAYYVPVPNNREECQKILDEFKGVFGNPAIEKIGQNIKYDIIVLKWYGIEVKGPLFDTMIAHYLLEPEQRHKLEHLSENFLNYKMVSIESLIGKKGRHQLSMGDIDQEKVKEYASEDADITYQLKSVFEPKVKEKDMWNLYQNLEIPLIPVLAEIEYNGFRIDADLLNDYSEKLRQSLIENEKLIYKQAGLPFNISSPKQVGEVLFDRLKIPYRWRRTASGQYSTNEEKLNELAFDHEIVRDIQSFRKLAKLKSTYVDALPVMINPKTGRIHSSFNQARAATGRLSSENPNLQNIPIKDEAGREVRKAFKPRDEEHILLAADYSQIELRLIAEISKEEAMLEAFIDNLDIHKSTAAKVYGVPIEEVTDEQRRNAKTVNFSIIYGAGSLNLSRQLDMKRTEAKELIDNYFVTYKGLKKYMEDIVKFARENDYVATLMGRRRYLKDINSRNGFLRSNAERIAINTPIQGSAADMIKAAMINVHRRLKNENFQSKMILQVHDELVFDVHKSELELIKPLISEEMKNAFPELKVPIEVSMGTGENWLEAH